MLRGIDISNWQQSINLKNVFVHNPDLDFVICKATEGTSYVDKMCDKFVQHIIAEDKLFGYYHFARYTNAAEREAEIFADMTEGYLGRGIPVLDLEDMAIADWKGYVDSFTKRFHDLTNVWPMVYCSAGHLPKLRGCNASKRCALWVAGYPQRYLGFDGVEDMPYGLNPWSTWTLWQFTSNGRLSGYDGDLDLDFGNLTKDAWKRIATGERHTSPLAPSDDELTGALQVVSDHVIAGEFGNGDERKEKLYNAVQEQVNLRIVH